MPVIITHTSDNPNFTKFEPWIEAKKAAAQEAGNTAEVQKIQAALDAKVAANAGLAAGATSVAQEDGVIKETTIRNELTVSVPEFDEYWNQWAAEFNVQVSIQPV